MPNSHVATRRRDRRVRVALAVLAGITVLGAILNWQPLADESDRPESLAPFPSFKTDSPGSVAAAISVPESAALSPNALSALSTAESAIGRQRYDEAISVLNSTSRELRDRPRALLLMGRALEARREFALARDFYVAALDRDPLQSDAYWGVATTSESLGDLEAALGAMRSYLHTESDPDPQRLRVAQARSAIWEWESKLGRGPWGPTRGIPPGFTEEEIRRDGRGVGIKMAIPGTERPDGTAEAEMKHAEKTVIFAKP